MNGVAVISQLTIDCIYADFPRFPEKGERGRKACPHKNGAGQAPRR